MFNSFKRVFLDVPECPDCGPLPVNHFQNYLGNLLEVCLFSKIHLPSRLHSHSEKLLVRFFVFIKLISLEENFDKTKISLRTTVFAEQAEKCGIRLRAFRGPKGYLNDFLMEINGRTYLIEGLPRVEWLAAKETNQVDDKAFIREKLAKAGLPVAEGKSFSFINQKQAMEYGENLGFPLVVKPRLGSMSHHITIAIKNQDELKKAIKKALKYGPAFIVEKYLEGVHVYRATVIDEEFVACAKRMPAHVIGSGKHTIAELIKIKNLDPRRAKPKQKNSTLFQLVIDETSHKLLQNQGYDFSSVPKKDEIVFLQEKVILDLGADLFEVTPKVHPDNIVLFRQVAKLFKIKLVGIDFLCEDISRSWQEQKSALIELNSLPYIDMHHFPTEGEPVNVAGKLCDMVLRYY